MKIKHPKFPKTRVCLIGDILSYASQMNGLVKDGRKAAIINEALSNIENLNRIPSGKWRERKKLLRGLSNLDKIPAMEKIELVDLKASCARFENSSMNDMKAVAEMLGLYVYKVDGAVIVLKTPLTITTEGTKSLADMDVSELGASSPELPLV